MAYAKTLWVNDQAPDIDAAHLNKIEDGIESAHGTADNAETGVASLGVRVDALEAAGGVSYRRYTKDVVSRGASPGGADNTAILQAILDECRDAGVGEVYFPGKPGDTYSTKGLWVPSGCRIVSDPGVILNVTGPSGAHAKDGGGHDSIYVSGDLRVTSWDGDLVASDGLYFGTQTRLDSNGQGGASAVAGAGGSSGDAGVCHDVAIEGLIIDGGTCVYQAVDGIRIVNVIVRNAYFGHAFANVRNGDQGYNSIDACRDVLVDEGAVESVVRNGVELSSVRGVLIRGHRVSGVTGNTSSEQAPGVGYENELEASTSAGRDIQIIGCRAEDCAGSAVAFIRANGPTDCDRNQVIGLTYDNVATVSRGSGNGPSVVGTEGAVWIRGLPTWEVVTLVGVVGTAIQHGDFLSTDDVSVQGKVIATGCVASSGNSGHDAAFGTNLVTAGCVGV